jgi:hypothetical protein
MIESMLVVLSRALDNRDDELNDWYTHIHIRDALRFRGSIATQRFARAEAAAGPVPADFTWRYLALYECYDAERFTREHYEAADSVRMEITAAFDNSEINDFYYYPLAWRSNDEAAARPDAVIVEFVNGDDAALRDFYESYFPRASRRAGVHSAALLAYRPHGQLLPTPPGHRYVAIYWTHDAARSAEAWRADPVIEQTPAVDRDSLMVLGWRGLTRRLVRDDVSHTSAADLAGEEAARARLRKRPPSGRGTRAALGLA